LRPATDPIRAFSLKKTVHKFVDVKTKKSKEVSVRFFGRREWESGDRFRLFFFSFLLFAAAVKTSSKLSRGLEKEKREEFVTTKRRARSRRRLLSRGALFFSPNERKRLSD
jgi:hypothetical protein